MYIPILTGDGPRRDIPGQGTAIRTKSRRCRVPLSVVSLLWPPLSPIVEYVDPGNAIAGLVRAVHRHTLDHRAETARQHLAVGFLAREIDARQHVRHAGMARDHGNGVEQSPKALSGARPRPDCGELCEAAA